MEEVQNSKSVLFQFINENNSVKIGFRNFIVNEVNDQELEKIVSEEKVIAIKWPNCDIGPATKMNARLRASPDFNFTVVKVIAFGEYRDLLTKKMDLFKFNTLEPSKSMRRNRHVKKYNSFLTPQQEKENKKQKDAIKAQQQPKKDVVRMKHQSQQLMKEIEDSNASKNIWLDIDNPLSDLESEEADAEFQSEQDIFKDAEQIDNLEELETDTLKEIIEEDSSEYDLTRSKTREIVEVDFDDEILKENDAYLNRSYTSKSMANDSSNDAPSDEGSEEEQFSEEEEERVTFRKATPTRRPSWQETDHHSAERKLIDIGGRFCRLSKIETCSTKSISKFTSDLADVVFSRKELCNSTLSGKKCNANKDKNTPVLPALDAKCVEEMLKITKSKFGKTNDVEKLFRIALRDKCSNAKGRRRRPLGNINA